MESVNGLLRFDGNNADFSHIGRSLAGTCPQLLIGKLQLDLVERRLRGGIHVTQLENQFGRTDITRHDTRAAYTFWYQLADILPWPLLRS